MERRKAQRRKRRGFTLLEAVIVLTIIGTILGVFVYKNKNSDEAAKVMGLLNEANVVRAAVLQHKLLYREIPEKTLDNTSGTNAKTMDLGNGVYVTIPAGMKAIVKKNTACSDGYIVEVQMKDLNKEAYFDSCDDNKAEPYLKDVGSGT